MGRLPLRRHVAHMSVVVASKQTCLSGESAGEPVSPELASHLVPLPLVFLDDVQAGVGAMCTSMRFDSQMVDLGGQNLVVDYLVPQVVYYDKRPAMVATPMRFSTATTFLRRVPQAPQMQNARMTPEQAPQSTLHSLKATMLSIAKRIDVPEHHRAEQGHRRQYGGRASVRLDSRDDVRGCACVPATRCSESDRRFPTTHIAGTLSADPFD